MKLSQVPVTVPAGTIAPVPGRAGVLAVESAIKRLPQVAIETVHDFSPGVYTRRIFIPAGVALAGKIHRFEHFNIVLHGDISVMTEKGFKRVKGPAMFKSPAGVKRAGYAFADTTWITIHPNPDDLTDVEELERRITADDYEHLKESIVEGEFECLS